MSFSVSVLLYVDLKKPPTFSFAYGNNTSITNEIGVVVPSMSSTITFCNSDTPHKPGFSKNNNALDSASKKHQHPLQTLKSDNYRIMHKNNIDSEMLNRLPSM